MIPLLLLGLPAKAENGGRRGVATVIFCGLGGALVGLSTLSFYGNPQDHTGNIYAGLGLGLVLGTVYVLNEPSGTIAALPKEKAPLPGLSDFKDFRVRTPATFEVAAFRYDF